jgi:rfaE bifunctional protein kinase chain/domain
MIQMARTQATPVIVDPKGRDFSGYHGATVVTPNELELREVVGAWASNDEMVQKAKNLIKQLELDGLLVTQGERGMTFFQLGQEPLSESVRRLEVYDVSGAGDTVAAMVAVSLAAHQSWQEILQYSNVAAGVVVAKLGTAIATLAEIRAALSESTPQ